MKYKSGYKYVLYETITIQSPYRPDMDIVGACCGFVDLLKNGMMTVWKNYAWDGPSGPSFDTKSFMRGSLFHDVSYQLIRERKLSDDNRKLADNWLRRMCKDDGMLAINRWLVHFALCRFCSFAINPEYDSLIKEAP